MDYIHKEVVIKHIEDIYEKTPLDIGNRQLVEAFKTYIENVPTADVVEVIRCKDCKYCTKAVSIENTYFCVVGTNAFDTELDNFCSYGERKSVTDTNVGGKSKNDFKECEYD